MNDIHKITVYYRNSGGNDMFWSPFVHTYDHEEGLYVQLQDRSIIQIPIDVIKKVVVEPKGNDET